MAIHVHRRARRLALHLAALFAGGALGCVSDVAPTEEAECSPGERRCDGATPEVCGSELQWQPQAACSLDAPFCVGGACGAEPPSCASSSEVCGTLSESCCVSLPVTGGQFQGGDPVAGYLGTVDDFKLDKYEVTVGRFRRFVEGYPGTKPAAGAGAHPLIDGSGWREEWSASLPATQEALLASVKCTSDYRAWTDEAGANEGLPINCVSWFVAFAFCAWDGGRLPTNVEWNYAATGGTEQRQYPWGDAPEPSPTHAVYDCMGDGSAAQDCSLNDILRVGSLPSGNGRFGQSDLAGSMFEWALDWFGVYPDPCVDCANIDSPGPDTARTAWGGDWSHAADLLFSYSRLGYGIAFEFPTHAFHGIRCARE